MLVLLVSLVGLMVAGTEPSQPPGDWQEGARALAAGEYQAALEVFVDITDASPEVAAAHFNLGLAHEGLGEYQLAVECLRRAVGLDSGESAYRVELARLLLKTDDVGEIAAVLQPVEVDGLDDETRSQITLLRARAATRIGHARDAVRLLRGRLRGDPQDPQLHHALGVALKTIGESSSSVDELARAFELEPESEAYGRAAVQMAFANARALEGTHGAAAAYARAAELAERLVELRTSLEHVLLAGEGWMEAGRCERALPWFQMAQGWQPRSTLVLLHLGRCHCDQGDNRRALEELQQALRIGARGTLRTRIYQQLGEVYLRLDELDWAISAYSQAGDRERVRELIDLSRSRQRHGAGG